MHVAPDYFDVLGAGIVAGRTFHSGDVGSDARPVIVNRSFTQRVLGGASPIGRRVRYTHYDEDGPITDPDAQPWYEIVGVVPDLGTSYGNDDPKIAAVYHTVAPGATGGRRTRIAIHVGAHPDAFTARLRGIAAATDPALRLEHILPLDRLADSEVRFYAIWFRIVAGASAVALVLSLAGIFAVMSFTVSQRTREIGIRVALGADHFRVIRAVFRRPGLQLALGIGAGGLILGTLIFAIADWSLPDPRDFGALLVYLAIMTAIYLLSWIVPVRRAMAIEPMEALRVDG